MKAALRDIAIRALPVPKLTTLLHFASVAVKIESEQWAGTAKYRMVYSKLAKALYSPHFEKDSILTEASAGSTGVALAFAGRHLGFPVEIHAYEGMSSLKCRLIDGFGAKLVFHPRTKPFPEILATIRTRVQQGTHWHLDQMDRNSLLDSYISLGAETVMQWTKTNDRPPTVFVCPVGTGGLLMGVGRILREAFPKIRVVALEPQRGTHIEGLRNANEMHLGAADPYALDFPDERVEVSPPPYLGEIGSTPLGQSATAAWDLIRQRGWERAIFIAPD